MDIVQICVIYVDKISHNLGCWTVCVGDGPCNACATIPRRRAGVCRHQHHHNAPQNARMTLLLAKVIFLLLRSLNSQV